MIFYSYILQSVGCRLYIPTFFSLQAAYTSGLKPKKDSVALIYGLNRQSEETYILYSLTNLGEGSAAEHHGAIFFCLRELEPVELRLKILPCFF